MVVIKDGKWSNYPAAIIMNFASFCMVTHNECGLIHSIWAENICLHTVSVLM